MIPLMRMPTKSSVPPYWKYRYVLSSELYPDRLAAPTTYQAASPESTTVAIIPSTAEVVVRLNPWVT